jgi:hypothetical protein
MEKLKKPWIVIIALGILALGSSLGGWVGRSSRLTALESLEYLPMHVEKFSLFIGGEGIQLGDVGLLPSSRNSRLTGGLFPTLQNTEKLLAYCGDSPLADGATWFYNEDVTLECVTFDGEPFKLLVTTGEATLRSSVDEKSFFIVLDSNTVLVSRSRAAIQQFLDQGFARLGAATARRTRELQRMVELSNLDRPLLSHICLYGNAEIDAPRITDPMFGPSSRFRFRDKYRVGFGAFFTASAIPEASLVYLTERMPSGVTRSSIPIAEAVGLEHTFSLGSDSIVYRFGPVDSRDGQLRLAFAVANYFEE